MDSDLIGQLLHEEEGLALDFKRDQYPFVGANDFEKSELLKDILAFANAWRRTEAFILIGVEEVKGGRSIPVGITTPIDDAQLQQFVNAKLNKPLAFSYETIAFDGKKLGIIRVEVQERPFYLTKDYGKLKENSVYIRRNSSTEIAKPDEVARMGQALARDAKPVVEESLKVSLTACCRMTPGPTIDAVEPYHLEIELTVTNVGNQSVFIVAAALKDKAQRHSLGFVDVCSEAEPLLPGGRRKEILKLLYHGPYPRPKQQPFPPWMIKEHNRFTYKLLRFICQEDSVFRLETGRGTILTYPSTEVCDDSFLGWSILATPQDVLDELGSKSLDDLLPEFIRAHEAAEAAQKANGGTGDADG